MAVKITTVAEFIAWIEGRLPLRNNQGHYIYHGFRDAQWLPQSAIYREIIADSEDPQVYSTYKSKVELLLRGAKDRRLNFSGPQPNFSGTQPTLSDLELMADLQHNHARTMLIDFSHNPLVALWFACYAAEGSSRYGAVDGRILALDTGQLVFKDITPSASEFGMTLDQCLAVGEKTQVAGWHATQGMTPKWYIWRSQYLTERTKAQDSYFIFGWPEQPDDLLAAGDTLLIDGDAKPHILDQLDRHFGIEAAELFPDRPGYARWHKVPTPSAQVFLRQALNLLQQGEYAQAILDYDKAIDLDSDDPIAYNYRGFAKGSLEQYLDALVDYDLAIELDPNYAIAYNNRGFVNRNLERYEQAILDYDRTIALAPDYASAYNDRGFTHGILGQHEQAMTDYDKSIELDPSNATVYNNRGFAKHHLKQYEAALVDYNKSLMLCPHYAVAYNNRGFSKGSLERYEDAILDYNMAIKLAPNYDLAYNNRGFAKSNLARYSEAIFDYDRAIELDFDDAVAYSNRGIAKQHMQRYDEAILDYDKAIAYDTGDAVAYNNRGLAKASLERYEEAIFDYEKAIQLDSKNTAAYHNRSGAYNQLGETAQAQADLAIVASLGNEKSADKHSDEMTGGCVSSTSSIQ